MLLASSALGLVNLVTNWPPIVVALPGLRVREAAVANTAGSALSNTVPQGGALATGVNDAVLRSWGFTIADSTSEVSVTGTWSQLAKYILLAIGLVAVVIQGWAPGWVNWVAVAAEPARRPRAVATGAHPAQCSLRLPARRMVRPGRGASAAAPHGGS